MRVVWKKFCFSHNDVDVDDTDHHDNNDWGFSNLLVIACVGISKAVSRIFRGRGGGGRYFRNIIYTVACCIYLHRLI